MGGKRKQSKSTNQSSLASGKLERSTISWYWELFLALVSGTFSLWGVPVNFWLGLCFWVGAIVLLIHIVWSSPWTHNRLVYQRIIISVTVAGIMIFIAWNPGKSAYTKQDTQNQQGVTQDRLSEDKIKLFIAYAYTFDNYRGSANAPGNEERILDTKIPLRRKFNQKEEVGFSFGIASNNGGIPLRNAILHIQFPEDGLEVKAQPGWETRWPNKIYYFRYKEDVTASPWFNLPFLLVKYTHPGQYSIIYTINGMDLSGRHIHEIENKIEIILYDDAIKS